MGFTDWFGMAIKRNKEVDVKKIKKQNVDMGAMAAGSPSEAAEALGKMIDQKNAPTKVLMVQDGEYMTQVTDYALKMAQRLDCEIIALDVTEKPLQFSGERKARESDRFIEMARQNAKKFTSQATAQGIKVEHIMDIDKPEKVVARVSAADAGIRYVLSKPEGEMANADQQRPHVPVFDLHCSRL
jgi:predicted enzyme involved in methoxymalonyl-ACP biosynthesis